MKLKPMRKSMSALLKREQKERDQKAYKLAKKHDGKDLKAMKKDLVDMKKGLK